jgi:hypothetical protein
MTHNGDSTGGTLSEGDKIRQEDSTHSCRRHTELQLPSRLAMPHPPCPQLGAAGEYEMKIGLPGMFPAGTCSVL